MEEIDDEISDIFKNATIYVRGATEKFSSNDLLYLYSRFKQGPPVDFNEMKQHNWLETQPRLSKLKLEPQVLGRFYPDIVSLNFFASFGHFQVNSVNEGPCSTQRPGFFDFQGRQKWDSWKKLGNLGKKEAMLEYVNKVLEVDPDWEEKVERGEVKARAGLGVAVSTLHAYESELDAPLSDDEKSIVDWCKEGDAGKVRQLLNTGEPPHELNQLDGEGLAPLHWACDRGHENVVDLLLSHGADINVRDADGQTPLHYAISCEHDAVVELLIRRGADTTLADSDGTRPQDMVGENSTIAAMLSTR